MRTRKRLQRSKSKPASTGSSPSKKSKKSYASPDNFAGRVMHLQRTIGNQATIQLLQCEQQDEESPVKTKQRHLDRIENTELPGLREAAKSGDVTKFTKHMAHLLKHPLLLYSGTPKQFAKILGMGVVKGKFAVLSIYTRYVAAGKELAAICKKYDADPRFYELIRMYRERKAKAKTTAKEMRNSKGFRKKKANKKLANRPYTQQVKMSGMNAIRHY